MMMKRLLLSALLLVCSPAFSASVFSVVQGQKQATTGEQDFTNSDISSESEVAAIALMTGATTLNSTLDGNLNFSFGWLGGDGTAHNMMSFCSEDNLASTDTTVTGPYDSKVVSMSSCNGEVDRGLGVAWTSVTDGMSINWTTNSGTQQQFVGGVFAGSGISQARGTVVMDSIAENSSASAVDTGIDWDAIIFIWNNDDDGSFNNGAQWSIGFVDRNLNQRTYAVFVDDNDAALAGNAIIRTDRVGTALTNGSIEASVEITNKSTNSFTATMRDGAAAAGSDLMYLAIASSDWDFEVGGDTLPTSGNNTITTGVDGKFLMGVLTSLTSVDDSSPIQTSASNSMSIHLVDDSGTNDEYFVAAVQEDASDPTSVGSRTGDGLDLLASSSGTLSLDTELTTTLNDGDITHTISNNPSSAIQYIYLVAGPTASSGPSFTSGPTIAAATDGYTVSGTASGSGTLTVYAVGVAPADGTPTCTQIKAGQNDAGATAELSANEVWTTDVADDFLLTKTGAHPDHDIHVCLSDGSSDTVVSSFADERRSADSGQAFVDLTSVADTSIFGKAVDTTGDTTNTSAQITGMADTSDFEAGMDVTPSAGFASGTVTIVTIDSATALTVDEAANSTQANITLTEVPYYDPDVSTDVVEYDKSTDDGYEVSFEPDGDFNVAAYNGMHDGSNNASVLADSTQNWVTDELVGQTINNEDDGSSCVVTGNTATTITCSGGLSGGTEDDWDSTDIYTLVPVEALSSKQSFNYNIQDLSDTSDGDFDSGPPAWTAGDDTVFINNSAPNCDPDQLNPIVLDYNVAMDEVDMEVACTDADGEDTISVSVSSGTLPTGVSLGTPPDDNLINGTPTVENESGATIVFDVTDGAETVQHTSIFYVIDTYTAPDCTDGTVAACITAWDAVTPWLGGVTINVSAGCSDTVAADDIISQTPVESTEVDDPYQAVAAVVSTGVACATGVVSGKTRIMKLENLGVQQ